MRVVIASVLLLLLGSLVQAAEPILLRAGPLTMVFEPDNAFLRYVRHGSHEILRGINAPIRDQFWGTVQPEVSNLELHDQGNHFLLEFDASCRERDIDFLWHGTIKGSANGTVELTFDGEARSTFMRNRIGFCVLHGPSAAGKAWIIEHADGEDSTGRFPTFISPHQPAKDIRAITHEVSSDIRATVRFEGEVFEMEDQRNWTDASFKTYCIPLAIPYPVQVSQGDRVRQRVILSITGGNSQATTSPADERVLLSLASHKSPVPRLGLQVSSEADRLNETQLQRLRALNLDHLRVNLALAEPHFASRLRRAVSQADSLQVTLHVGLNLGENPVDELRRLANELESTPAPVSVWLINEADEKLFELAYQHLQPHLRGASIGVSQDTNFVELNRARPEDGRIEAVSYGINPQIHAIDNASIIETLPIQGDTVRSAQQFIGERRLIVGPITLRPQPVNVEPAPGELPPNVDVRQTSLFAAGWTLGSLMSLSGAAAPIATYFETVGWKGIMENDVIPPGRAEFPSRAGEAYPVYHVLRSVAEFADGDAMELTSSAELSVVGMALTKDARMRLLVANLSGHEQTVTVRGAGKHGRISTMDGQSSGFVEMDGAAVSGTANANADELPLVIPPYGIVRIDREL